MENGTCETVRYVNDFKKITPVRDYMKALAGVCHHNISTHTELFRCWLLVDIVQFQLTKSDRMSDKRTRKTER